MRHRTDSVCLTLAVFDLNSRDKGSFDEMKFISGFVVLAVTLMSAQSWGATGLTQGLGQSDFPVRVEAVVFPSGNTIGAGRSVCWSQWCAYSESKTAIATWATFAGPGTQAVDIENLACKNDVLGTRSCSIRMFVKGGRPFHCLVDFSDTSDDLGNFSIKCPVSLR